MKKIIFVLLVCLVSGAVFVFTSEKLKVRNVECKSQYGPCSGEVNQLIEKEVGKSFFDVKRNLAKTLSVSPRIEYYNIRFNLPGTLLVDVVEKKPEVALKFGEGRYFLFDKTGNSLGEVSETALPVIEVADVPSDNSVKYAAVLFWNLFKYYDISRAGLDKYGLTADIRGSKVIFPLDGDIDVIFGTLEVVLLQLNREQQNPTITTDAGKYSTIDLRYKNPVIR